MEENDSVLNAIIIASIAGIVIVAGLILFYPRPSEDFTALYFGNYTKTPENGTVSFDFTIENHDNRDMSYIVDYQIDNKTVSSENIFVPDNGNITISKEMQVNRSGAKVGVLLNTTEEVHFWTAG